MSRPRLSFAGHPTIPSIAKRDSERPKLKIIDLIVKFWALRSYFNCDKWPLERANHSANSTQSGGFPDPSPASMRKKPWQWGGNRTADKNGRYVRDRKRESQKQLAGRSTLHSGECLMTGPTLFTPRQEERTIQDDME